MYCICRYMPPWGIALERNLFIIADAGVAGAEALTRGRGCVHYGALLTEGAPRWTSKVLDAFQMSATMVYRWGEVPQGRSHGFRSGLLSACVFHVCRLSGRTENADGKGDICCFQMDTLLEGRRIQGGRQCYVSTLSLHRGVLGLHEILHLCITSYRYKLRQNHRILELNRD